MDELIYIPLVTILLPESEIVLLQKRICSIRETQCFPVRVQYTNPWKKLEQIIPASPFHFNPSFKLCPGPGCSKLTMSLVNEMLKFRTLMSQIPQYFLLKKRAKLLHSLIFSTKNISVIDYEVVKHLTR